MPWLRDDNNNIVIGESGNPVYEYPDGNKIDFNADEQVTKIRELTTKASKRKEQIEGLNGTLSILTENGIDVSSADSIKEFFTTAKSNADTVKNLDDKKLVDAGEVESIKESVAKSFRSQLENQKKSYETKLTKASESLALKDQAIHKSIVKAAFIGSDFIRKKTSYPTPEIAYKDLRGKFIVEEIDGEAVGFGVDSEGNKLYSLQSPTEHAKLDEAIEIVVNTHPQKDRLLLVDGGGGGSDSKSKKDRTIASVKTVDKTDRLGIGKNAEDIASGKVTVEM